KALNYGLEHAQGEFVVVFDAEDRPSPGQPREAMAAFARGGRDLAVVQAPLLIDNARDSWLSRQFELEYAIHFLVWLPFLAKIKAPIALGGTSNYFRRRQLEDAGGWDAWNVTEDADLGLRLARFGREAAMITLPTWEEAPSRPGEWMKQRTRWMKGHLQTWLVASRAPFSGKQRFNPGEFLSIQMTLGGSLLASLLHGPLLVWLIYGLATQQAALQGWHLGLFAAGYVGVLLAALAALGKPRLTALLLLPLYWPLLSIAMLRALWEMKTRPQFWAKTQHGFSRTRPVQQVINTPVHETPLDNVIQLDFGF
ncbi:MAG TPA: glycosyltransferase family 2 protein, partial [Hyphomonadaceae bacterium]|nr:glycosyltransferase family 2 protein [Hyphomonadaceae bacterium]